MIKDVTMDKDIREFLDRATQKRLYEEKRKRKDKRLAKQANLAKLLRTRVGRGYSRPNLNNMRKFYLMYPIIQTSDKSGLSILPTSGICQTSDKLTWSHICELITIDDQLEREFYEKECIAQEYKGGVRPSRYDTTPWCGRVSDQ